MHALTNFTAYTASFVLLFMLIYFVNLSQSAQPTYCDHLCSNAGTFTPGSMHQSNLKDLLHELSSQAKQGKSSCRKQIGPDNSASNTTVYGSYFCRGDVDATVCKDCVVLAAKDGTQRCPVGNELVIWYDECTLRYSYRSFLDDKETPYGVPLPNKAYVSEPDRFQMQLQETMNNSLREVENANKWFLTKEIKITELTGIPMIYSLMQCAPDMSGGDCTACLRLAIEYFSLYCARSLGGRVLFPSCNVRHEIFRFYNPSDPLPPPGNIRRISKPTIVGIAISVTFISLAFGTCCLFHHRKVKAKKHIVEQRENEGIESLQFDLITVQTATKKFSRDNKLGEGGFGEVYKRILAEGQEIAVKRLSKSSGQAEQKFKNEVSLVAKLQHRNLVRLLGFCLGGGETILVYEFVHNKSLDYFLFGLFGHMLYDIILA